MLTLAEIERRIRERAYFIWRDGAMACGDAEEHWIMAERTLIAELIQAPARRARRVAVATSDVLPKRAATKKSAETPRAPSATPRVAAPKTRANAPAELAAPRFVDADLRGAKVGGHA